MAAGTWDCDGAGIAAVYITADGRWSAELEFGVERSSFDGTWVLEDGSVHLRQQPDRARWRVEEISTNSGSLMSVLGDESAVAEIEVKGKDHVSVVVPRRSDPFDCRRTTKSVPNPLPARG